MRPEIRRGDAWSFNEGREIVERKGLKEELPAIAEAYIDYGGGNQYLSDRRELLDPLGWVQEVSVKFETTTDYDVVSRQASFDAYTVGQRP